MLNWLLGSIVRSIFESGIFLMVSIGLTLTLAVVKLPNFAHAEFITIGAYTTLIVTQFLPNNLPFALIASFLISGLIAIVVHQLAYKPLIKRSSLYILVLASFAVAQFLRYTVFILASIGGMLSAHPLINVVPVLYIAGQALTNIYLLTLLLAILSAVFL